MQSNSNQSSSIQADTFHATPPPKDTTIANGKLEKHYPSGVIEEISYYKNGRRDGECQSFYENGKIWSDDYFVDGLKDGPTTTYYDNGQKHYTGSFTKGKPSGVWKLWNEQGKLIQTVDYNTKSGSSPM